MSAKTTPTRKQIIRQVIAALDGPTLVNDIVERVRQLYPSQAKDPRQAIRNELPRLDGRDFVFLDRRTILPMRLALQGVRFRISWLDPEEVRHGALFVQPAFQYFLSCPPEQAWLVDAHDRPLPTRLTTFAVDVEDELFGRQDVYGPRRVG
jgi:hypothetical protein